jgi:membrane fusion protein, multidrug efflux system
MRSIAIVVTIILLMIIGKWLMSKKAESASSGPPMSTSAPKPGGQGGPAGPGKPGNGGPAFPVSIQVATLEDVSDKIFASGSFVPNEQVDLRSEASGIIKSLFINEGTSVKQGQLIAKIKDDDIRAQIKKLEFEDQLATQIEARQKKLLDINAISKEEYDIAVNKINTLGADKEALMVRLRQTEVRAPFSGRIGFKNISVGAYVTPSITIASLVQISPIKIDFDIPEKYNTRLSVGKTVMISTEDNNAQQSAKVIAINPVVDETLRSVRLRASLANSSGTLKPGMFARIEVPLSTTRSIMIPTEALIPFAGGKKLFIMKDGKAVEVPVVSGLRTETELEIINGLAPGDSVVISGLMNIKAGQSLTVKSVK